MTAPGPKCHRTATAPHATAVTELSPSHPSPAPFALLRLRRPGREPVSRPSGGWGHGTAPAGARQGRERPAAGRGRGCGRRSPLRPVVACRPRPARRTAARAPAGPAAPLPPPGAARGAAVGAVGTAGAAGGLLGAGPARRPDRLRLPAHEDPRRPQRLRHPAGQRLLLGRRHRDGQGRPGRPAVDAAGPHPHGRPVGGARRRERLLLLRLRHLAQGHRPGGDRHGHRRGHPGRLHHHPAVREERLPQPEPDAVAQGHRDVHRGQAGPQDEQAADPRRLPQHQLVRPRRLRGAARRQGLLRQGRLAAERERGRLPRHPAQGRRALRPRGQPGQPPACGGALEVGAGPDGDDRQDVGRRTRHLHRLPRAEAAAAARWAQRADRLPGGHRPGVRLRAQRHLRRGVRPRRLPDLHHLRAPPGAGAGHRGHAATGGTGPGTAGRRPRRAGRRRLGRHRRPHPGPLRRTRLRQAGLRRRQHRDRAGGYGVRAARLRGRTARRRAARPRRTPYPGHPRLALRRRRQGGRHHPRGPLLEPGRQDRAGRQRRAPLVRADHPAGGGGVVRQRADRAARHGRRPGPGAPRLDRRGAAAGQRIRRADPGLLARHRHPEPDQDGRRLRHLRGGRRPHRPLLGAARHPRRRAHAPAVPRRHPPLHRRGGRRRDRGADHRPRPGRHRGHRTRQHLGLVRRLHPEGVDGRGPVPYRAEVPAAGAADRHHRQPGPRAHRKQLPGGHLVALRGGGNLTPRPLVAGAGQNLRQDFAPPAPVRPFA
ncbi:hypothetical protein SCOCK_60019 [Actinacidiphila cocklensis]|uniref:Uncharacterized protein n=1 Tax=Actinacidiphila cocklensis TaxID=887465 RepID=A0A9W4E1F7_9ACTN|nr:hypothetical protein SCOCK_60019 [Actinacidiphila cocklensis]